MTTTETTIDTGTSELLCVIRDRVAVITLNRPKVRNALSDNLTPALRTMIKTCGENPDVGALLITGAGAAFCAGGNVKGMGAHRDQKKLDMSYDEKVADLQERQRLLTGALISVRKPTLAIRARSKRRSRGDSTSAPVLIRAAGSEARRPFAPSCP